MTDPIDELRAVPTAVHLAASELANYLDKVRNRAYTVTDADIEALTAAGVSEDEIFEQTVAVAVTEGLRRLDAGLEAIG